MNTIVVYASMTGTTELMARTIADELTKAGDQVVVKDALEAYADELSSYERILVGSYTWGDGELSDEIMGFYDELETIDLAGKSAAAFGSGCSSYEQFASAVDILEEALKRKGCSIITAGLKADTWSDDEEKIEANCVDFVKRIITLS
ncbi:flavodoxin domain-containing protein [Niallia oryzisoli]|uniref:flavodoxin domain-containing protein n=1 Tax=Niallia oryzisoli TaxID=1737571 RepID=UPI0037358399